MVLSPSQPPPLTYMSIPILPISTVSSQTQFHVSCCPIPASFLAFHPVSQIQQQFDFIWTLPFSFYPLFKSSPASLPSLDSMVITLWKTS